MFNTWCFDPHLGDDPDLHLHTDKKLCVKELRKRSNGALISTLTNKYAHRISSIRIDFEGAFFNSFIRTLQYDPLRDFEHVTSLDLEAVPFHNDFLLMLAPNLEYLRLLNIKRGHDIYEDYQIIPFVDDESTCYTKIKTLILDDDNMMNVILRKCCNSLEYLECYNKFSLEFVDVEKELSCIKHLSIYTDDNCVDIPSVRSLISKCSGSLNTLKLEYLEGMIDFSQLLEQTLKITTLVLDVNGAEEEIDKGTAVFLRKCPLIQNLTLIGFTQELGEFVLKDLQKLELLWCNSGCVNSILKQVSRSSLKTLHIENCWEEGIEFIVITELDTVWIDEDWCENFQKLFGENTKVKQLFNDI